MREWTDWTDAIERPRREVERKAKEAEASSWMARMMANAPSWSPSFGYSAYASSGRCPCCGQYPGDFSALGGAFGGWQ